MKREMKVLNFGSLNYDYVYAVDHILLPGETQSSRQRQKFLGGKGFNQSIALARAGACVCQAGTVGEDGDDFLKICGRDHVDIRHVRKTEGPSGHTVIQVDQDGQNSILLYGGSNREQKKEHIDEVILDFSPGDMILLQNEINCLDYIIERAYKRGMKIVLNPSPCDHNLEICDLGKVSLFLINEVEGEQLTGKRGPEEILDKMKEKYPKADVVLTLGEKGSVYQCGGSRIARESFSVKAVDTTAAGDTYTGYFSAGILQEMLPEDILERSSAAAALAVTKKGAVDSIPYAKDVLDFLEREKNL